MSLLSIPYASWLADFVALGHRQGSVEVQARKMIESFLLRSGVDFLVQEFNTRLPRYDHVSLVADGLSVPCLPTGLRSGEIPNQYNLLSSLISSQKNIDDTNINFNPRCPGAISQANFYFAPSVAVDVLDIPTLVQAKEVNGIVEVVPVDHVSANILVGNSIDPEYIVFTHYDSIGPGAIDNASGTYTVLRACVDARETLSNTLYVIAGNEELSYDYPVYWGRGYRAFEEQYGALLEKAKRMLIVDSVGNTKTTIHDDPRLLKLGFPIRSMDKYLEKTAFLMGDFDNLMQVYQSSVDTLDRLSSTHMDDVYSLLIDVVG